MAHEIYEEDSMMSVYETPWHGLGTVLADYPTIQEAAQASGLTWGVELHPIFHNRVNKKLGVSRREALTTNFILARDDTGTPLSVVGSRYVPYQNSQMWEFLDAFMKASASQIETAGSLRNGQIVWALMKNGELEYLKGDPVEQFFLFKNSYSGTQAIDIMFTDVRVVCNNTLTAAVREAKASFKVRHVKSAITQLAQIDEALGFRTKHQEMMKEAMARLIQYQMVEDEMRNAMDKILSRIVDTDDIAEEAPEESLAEKRARISASRQLVIDEVMELHDIGAGHDIPGVSGTAYGLLNAATEYSDHFRIVRPSAGRSEGEAMFESAIVGTGFEFKQRTFTHLLNMAEAA